MMDDIELQYYGEDEGLDNNEESIEEDLETREIRVNNDGKRVRGKDKKWVQKFSFSSAELYLDSDFLKELKEKYTLKRNNDLEYGEVHHYICKFAQKKRYFPCQHEYKVIFPSNSLDVIMSKT